MASSRSFFSPKSINSSNGFSTTNHIGSGGHKLSIYQQQRLLLEVQQRNTMVEKGRLRQPRSLVPTFCIKDVQNYHPSYVSTTHRIPSTMLQPYAIDGRERIGGSSPTANPTRFGGHAQPVTTIHLAMPKHVSSGTIFGYHHQKLKRKAITTDVPPRSSFDVALESATNVFFSFDKNCQEVQMHVAKKKKKKNTTMNLPLINENDADDAAERAAREMKFFPLSLNHGLPRSDSEFSVYEMSSVSEGVSDVELDLSLKLSPSSGRSGITVDLSLKL
ncbi:hypothetical protein PAHAL_5G254400 [Panicum hallii]|uniref:Uncharacterized protein n=1 Tax=Panicum hallii TaxID=206008 RepID=A0A2S3HUA5_9POAL|nr:hypothetical protein PAHAL_5G254400 [Panicum hallii]